MTQDVWTLVGVIVVFLGLLGFLLALTAAGSLAVYWILSVFET